MPWPPLSTISNPTQPTTQLSFYLLQAPFQTIFLPLNFGSTLAELFQICLSHFSHCSVSYIKITVMLFTSSLFPTRSSIAEHIVDTCWSMGSIFLKGQRSCENQTKMPPIHPDTPWSSFTLAVALPQQLVRSQCCMALEHISWTTSGCGHELSLSPLLPKCWPLCVKPDKDVWWL